MKRFFKGIIIGIGKVLPGVSGAILAILLDVYDNSIFYINNFFNNIRKSISYLFPLVVGIVVSIVLFSKLVSVCIDKYFLYTMMLFIGMIIGCLPEITNKIDQKKYFLIFFSFIFFFLISIDNISNNYIIKNNLFDIFIFFISGICEAIGTVVPGISSTALLMILGTYDTIILVIGNIIIDFRIIIPFIVGLLLGIIIVVKMIDYLLKNFKNGTYNVILGIVISSIILLIVKVFEYEYSIVMLLFGILFLILGIFISSLFIKK